MKTPKRTLVFDISNILFRVASVQKRSNPFARDAQPEDLVGLCMHISIQSIYKWFNKYNPDLVVFAFDGSNNWRKTYTAKNKSRNAYKGNRVVDPEMAHYYELLASFYETMKSYTSIICLKVDKMEADDSIAAYCQSNAAEDREIFIISGDKDFIQLLKLPGVKLIDPDTGKPRNQPGDKNYQEDIDYWLFEKCVRGDGGDNVRSAYPNVRSTKIQLAYKDDFQRVSFMNTTWDDVISEEVEHNGEIKTVLNPIKRKVGDLYNENVILLSLYDQPQEIKDELFPAVKEQSENFAQYSHFHFLRFLDKFNLNALRDNAMKYVGMFANNQRFLKGESRESNKNTLNKQERKDFDDNSGAEVIDMTVQKKQGLLEF